MFLSELKVVAYTDFTVTIDVGLWLLRVLLWAVLVLHLKRQLYFFYCVIRFAAWKSIYQQTIEDHQLCVLCPNAILTVVFDTGCTKLQVAVANNSDSL